MAEDKTLNERVKRYRRKHKGKIKARNAVNNAIRLGHMKDPPPGEEYHHGKGYSKKNAKRVTPMSHKNNAKKK